MQPETRTLAWILLTLLVLTMPPATVAAEIPDSLRDLVLGAGHRKVVAVELDGTTFRGLAPFSEFPYLLWPTDRAGVTYDHDEAAGWIRRSATDLGHRDFEPRYVETTHRRGDEVWHYQLVRRDIALHGARVRLHWQDRHLVGLENDVVLPMVSIEEPHPQASGPLAYTPLRAEEGYTVRLARVFSQTMADRVLTALVVGDETVRRLVAPIQSATGTGGSIQEWDVPLGTYPDQIDIDSTGLVWFSQPFDDWVTSFDPGTEAFTQHETTGGFEPDGMMVDGNDILWTGLYDADSGLGRLDIATSVFTTITAPYTPANAAIPNETTAGTIWVTDHLNNKISEYDPGSSSWVQSLDMPTPDAWVVAGTEDPASQDVYFTEYNVDRLGRKISGGGVVEIDLPPGSTPAFLVHSDGFIYYSQWSNGQLGAYEISSGSINEYLFPVPNEDGGPIDVTPDGLVAVGTRNDGYVMVFDPSTQSFDSYKFPTDTGLKDGLRSDSNGSIWIAETFANKIAVLPLGSLPPFADFLGAPTAGVAPLTVSFTDLTGNSPTLWSWSFGDGGTSSLSDPDHDYPNAGLYSVSLTASNEFGSNVETKVDYINVIPPCPLGPFDVAVSSEWVNQRVVLAWDGDDDCLWAVHRATDPDGILGTPPIDTVVPPTYFDLDPSEPMIFYSIAPMDKAP